MTLTGDVATAWGFIFMILELSLPIGMLYLFATGHSHKSAKRRRTAPGSPLTEPSYLPVRSNTGINMDEKAPLITNDSTVEKEEEKEDPDVATERTRVYDKPDENMMSAVYITKKFGEKIAVKKVSFGIRQGECFGLLGPNGAGKSTTCSVILRHLVATSRDVLFPYADTNSDVPDEEAFVKARIGVCMQGDSLWEVTNAAMDWERLSHWRLRSVRCKACVMNCNFSSTPFLKLSLWSRFS